MLLSDKEKGVLQAKVRAFLKKNHSLAYTIKELKKEFKVTTKMKDRQFVEDVLLPLWEKGYITSRYSEKHKNRYWYDFVEKCPCCGRTAVKVK